MGTSDGTAEAVPLRGFRGEKGLRVWVGLRGSGSFGCAQDDRWFGWVEMGGGGRARRAMPTHRKVRDGWGTRLLNWGLRWALFLNQSDCRVIGGQVEVEHP
jgi:hypothetical protein